MKYLSFIYLAGSGAFKVDRPIGLFRISSHSRDIMLRLIKNTELPIIKDLSFDQVKIGSI
jgi:hypothetical protein